MATATIRLKQEATSGPAQAWWGRKDPYLLAAVCGVHVVVVGQAIRDIGSQWWPLADDALLGVIFAECFLLALWAALGGLGTVARWCAVFSAFACGLASVAARQRLLSTTELWSEVFAIGLIGATAVTAMAAVLIPLRGLAGWRIDFSGDHYKGIRSRRGQLGILDFAALTCAVAAPLTAARLVNESGAWSAGDWPMFLAIEALVVVTAAPIAYAVVACRRIWLAAAVVAVWPVVVSVANSWLGLLYSDLLFFGGGPQFAGVYMELVAFHAGIALTVVATLAPLRLFGLQLLVVGQNTNNAVQTAPTGRGFAVEPLKPRKAA
jgi:hypothetical protein